jgi:riboflavin-specific deaminase-like protein
MADDAVQLRQIYPEAAKASVEEVVRGLDPGKLAPAGRPSVFANMIGTADGKATIGGRAGPIGNEADRALFMELRTVADAILVGSGTLRAESYGRLVRDPALRERRTQRGLDPDPLGCVVTHSGRLPFDIPLFSEPGSRVLVYTSVEGPFPETAADVSVIRISAAELTMTTVLERLRADHGVRSLLCEGGPTVLAALLAEEVLDELFLSIAPKLAGGRDVPTVVDGTGLPEPADLELVWAWESAGYLFLRYVTQTSATAR